MSYNFDHHPGGRGNARIVLAAALVLLTWALAMATWARAQKVASPPTPATITPPPGNVAFLVAHAMGTQGYVCLPLGTGASWMVNASRPEAILLAASGGHELRIINHYLSPDTNPNQFAPRPLPFGSPTWQSSWDGSKVWAETLNTIPAGSDSSCPNAGAIACLLLQSIGWEKGPAGGITMARTTFIQRLNTQGGSAPAAGCSIAGDVGKQALVPYMADYYFFQRSDKTLRKKMTRFEFLSQ